MTIRPHDAITAHPRRFGAVALLAACALLGSLLLAASASAAPDHRGHAEGTWVDTSTYSGAVVSGTGTPGAAKDPAATASVIGGHNTTVAKFPSLAYIEGVQATDGYACTGTVVAPRVILTAGHCVEDVESGSLVEPNLIGVATGVSNLQKIAKANISRVERVLVNPSFNPSKLQGDAGLLILSAPVTATPIRLATASDAPLYEAGTEVQIAGWGLDEFHSEHRPNQLQTGTVPIQSSSRCKAGLRLFYPFFDPTSQLCTLDTHHKVIFCHGDSGGPGMATGADGLPVELGVISLNDGVCNPRDPAVYTRVDQIQPWVQKWIEHVEAGGPEPVVRIPKAHLPTLTRERGEELSFILMAEKFGSRFESGHERTIHCSRQNKSKLKCDVTWWQGPNDYFGTISVFYAIRHNVVLADAHYSIKWVDDHCYFHSGHPQSCKVNSLSH